jgi:hypothetical protein
MVMPWEDGGHHRGSLWLHRDNRPRYELRCTTDDLDDTVIETLEPILYEQAQQVGNRDLMLLGSAVQLFVCVLRQYDSPPPMSLTAGP